MARTKMGAMLQSMAEAQMAKASGKHKAAAQRMLAAKKAPLGAGDRFAALKSELAGQSGVKDPGGLAAAIGRKKYGAKRFAALGRK